MLTADGMWEQNGHVHFRLKDIMAHLRQAGFRHYNEGQVCQQLRSKDGDQKEIRVKKRHIRTWYLPSSLFEDKEEDGMEVPEDKNLF